MSDGKLNRAHSGRLQRAVDGRLKRCGCCTMTPGCTYVLDAYPCFLRFDPDTCDSITLPKVIVCTDALCGADDPIGYDSPRVFALGDDCFKTDPDSLRQATEADLAVAYRGPLDCRALGCADPVCGDPDTYYPCGCVCASFYPEPGGEPGTFVTPQDPSTWCCVGRLGHREGDPPFAPNRVCWSVTYFETNEDRRACAGAIAYSSPLSDCGAGLDCNNGTSCVMSRTELRSVANSPDPNPCRCCFDGLQLEGRDTLKRLDLSNPLCDSVSCPYNSSPGGSPFNISCQCPNVADFIWRPSGHIDDICPPVNSGATSTFIYLVPPVARDHGCATFISRQVDTDNTCDHSSQIVTEIESLVDVEVCPDGVTGDPGDGACCFCDITNTSVQNIEITFHRPGAGDRMCSDCYAFLVRHWTPPGP